MPTASGLPFKGVAYVQFVTVRAKTNSATCLARGQTELLLCAPNRLGERPARSPGIQDNPTHGRASSRSCLMVMPPSESWFHFTLPHGCEPVNQSQDGQACFTPRRKVREGRKATRRPPLRFLVPWRVCVSRFDFSTPSAAWPTIRRP